MKSVILGVGHYVPSKIVTNADLAKLMETSDEWIQQRSGIRERRYVEEGMGNTEMAFKATRMALERAKIDVKEIDLLILATLSPDHTFPGTGCFVQEKLGLGGIPAIDIRQQCSGFIYGVSIADQFIRAGTYRTVLVIGTEVQSTGLDFSTRGRDVTILFGDGAGAVVMRASHAASENRGILSTHLHADGRYAKELWVEGPSSREHPRVSQRMLDEGTWYPRMNGRAVFTMAVKKMQEAVQEALAANDIRNIEDVDLFVFHQANIRIVQALCEQLRISMEKTYNNIHKYGNTTAASIPIALSEAVQEERLKENDLLCIAAFGSGFTWASALIRW
ncbi:MAG: beta-ketoacyl-ACP synthase III [Deltaproteobacteria bacterium]